MDTPKQLRAEAVRRLMVMSHRPDLARSPFAYLLLNDGALVVANFRQRELCRHLCEQLPPLAVDFGELPLMLPSYGRATSAAVVEKQLAIELHRVLVEAFPAPTV